MRKITLWIVGTLTVVALAIAFQLNVARGGGKVGEAGDSDHGITVQQTPAPTSSTAPPTSGSGSTDDKSGDTSKSGGDTNDESGKPGENK